MSSDPVLKILKVQLIFPLQMLTSTHVPPAKYLDAICSLMQLVQDARFIAIYIDAQTLLECDVDQVIDADRSLRGKLSKFTAVAIRQIGRSSYRELESFVMPAMAEVGKRSTVDRL